MPVAAFTRAIARVAGQFYPRLTYGTTAVDFPTSLGGSPAHIVVAETPIARSNVAEDGSRETLFQRLDVELTLSWTHLPAGTITQVLTWWRDWASKGKATAITLDRFDACGGQWEYDQYNTYFSHAELLNNPFGPQRPQLGRPKYALQLKFRQTPA